MENKRTIAQINRMLRSIVEVETLEQYFWVGGLVENFYESDFGHKYFTLVDDRSRIRCMLHNERAGHISLEIRNGLELEVYGDIHFYENGGRIEINVTDVRLVDTAVESRPVIEQLRADGVFPPQKKRPPIRIRRIGVITSRGSRAIGDFENAYRSAGSLSVLAPYDWHFALLEGELAPQNIVDGIDMFDKNPDCDVITIIRGGGRQKNLSTFDDLDVAKAIIRCSTFVLTGIGHHQDSTVADSVSDYSASTPTAAAHYLAQLCMKSKPKSGNFPAQRDKPSTFSGNLPVAAEANASRSDTLKWLLLALFGVAALILLILIVVLAGELIQV